MMPKLKQLKHLKSRLILASILTAVLFVCCLLLIRTDPHVDSMKADVFEEPKQTPIRQKVFSLSSNDKTYQIKTFFDYEQSGLVVSANNKLFFKPLLKMMNSQDLLNVNDLCVIWGNNIKSEVYKDMHFYQGAYTCYADSKKGRFEAAAQNYHKNQLAHNHILTNDPELQHRLKSVRKGDQIKFKGKLVSYTNNGRVIRTSSFSRNDNICETVLLEDLKIIKRHHPFYHALMKILIVVFLALTTTLFVVLKKIDKQNKLALKARWSSQRPT